MIREVRAGDVPALRRPLYAVSPELPAGTEAAVGHWLTSEPERVRFLVVVAEADGEVVG